MERLVTVSDIAERYGCSGKTARKYLRQMFHYENPLAAPRWAVDEWENSRAVEPGKVTKASKKPGPVQVPRKRG